jgi:hypothetical protein
MSGSTRLRMRMGCGEPLQSRRWVTAQAQTSGRQDDKSRCSRAGQTAAQRGVKCKS